ncbi:putative beta-lactamase [Naematelia encephala]|uniref:Putative beta-lactamase n=1 Tax=Naematelia encephala TaxID=71784 RepID=A0A1Y2BAY3_9TREE|nr:putative beta-lactamase [Naematelia encephala]
MQLFSLIFALIPARHERFLAMSDVVAPWDVTAPLCYGSPESVGLLPQPLEDLKANASSYLISRNYSDATYEAIHPLYPGVSLVVGHKNTIVTQYADGKALLYADANGTHLDVSEQVETEIDTIYDLASLSKLFATVVALDQLGQGLIQLNATVASYIPEFAANNKSTVTIEQLLTHTSGFDADPVPPLFPNYTTIEERRQAAITQALINPPGSTFLYSDLNLMNLGFVLESTTGKTLDQLVKERVTGPLGMSDTFYNSGNLPSHLLPSYDRIVATEFQIQVVGPTYSPPRPQPVRGTVHDENAWALDGVSGHAGVFSTAHDLAIFCQMILNNGTYAGVKILEPWTVDLIFHNFNTAFPGHEHGLGFELNQLIWSGSMASLQTAGHTGFTGTTIFIDRPTGTFAVQLTNRVHPSRKWSSTNISREFVGFFVAKALGRNATSPTIRAP